MSKSIADDPRIGVTHNRALCCEYGQLRLVSANGGYRPPQWVGEEMSDSEIASWGYDPAHVEPWQRATGALKCESCGVKTTHAVLRDCCENPAHRDICEQRMGSVHATADSPERALRRAGVRIFELNEPLEEKMGSISRTNGCCLSMGDWMTLIGIACSSPRSR